jgi:hypothetical protein
MRKWIRASGFFEMTKFLKDGEGDWIRLEKLGSSPVVPTVPTGERAEKSADGRLDSKA